MKPSFLLILLLAAVFRLAGGELTVLAVSDTHAGSLYWRRLAPEIARCRAAAGEENTLLLDAGDTLQGHWDGEYRDGAIPLAILNELRVDVWVPGNHDFEFSTERFLSFRGTMLGGDWYTARVKPPAWKMFERAGHKIAVIGLGEWGMRRRVLPDAGIFFRDRNAVLGRAVREAREAGAELMVLIQHDGEYSAAGSLYSLLKPYPEIALVIGAHTHQTQPGKKIGRAWFVQPGCYGKYLAVIRVTFRENGEPPVIVSELRPCGKSSHRWSKETFRMISASIRQGKRVLGKVPGGLAQPSSRDLKGPLGDLAERALFRQTGAQAVIFSMQQGTYRSPETVTEESLFRLFPYRSRICTASFTPAELEEAVRGLLKLQRRRRELAIRFGGMKVYRDKRGNLQRLVLPRPGADGRILVAIPDYDLTGCAGAVPVFSRMLKAGLPYRNTGILWRDAAARSLEP